MEPEGSLPHLQVPTTCPYPEWDRSSQCSHIPFHEDPPYYYPPIHAWVFQVVSFPQVSPPKPSICLSLPQYVLHAPPISFFLILSQFPPFPCYLISLRPKCPPRHPILKHLKPTFPFNVSNQVSHPYKTTVRIVVLDVLIFIFLDSKLEDKRFCTEW